METQSKPGISRAVWIAGALTLLISIARLYGEIEGWAFLTAKASNPGGGAVWFGIVWLVPIFGFVFGRLLASRGAMPPAPGRGLGISVIALAGLIGIGFWLNAQPAGDEFLASARMMWIGAPICAVLAFVAWRRAAWALLGYGLLARIPVIAIQFLAIQREWGTHYEKVHPKFPVLTAAERGLGLALTQLTVWTSFTIVAGTLCALIGAATVPRR